MSTTSESRADSPDIAPAHCKVLVWDAPVRVFHWLMVLCFAGAYLTAESERWRLVHVTLGYTMLGLVAFRMVWGLAGTRYARFSSFVRGPAAVARYLGSLWRRAPEHHMGHNPAGAVAIVAMLLLTVAVGASGWAVLDEMGGGSLEELHEGAANLMLAVVAVHVAGVLLSSCLHRENLIRAMVDGRKPGRPAEGAKGMRVLVAALLLAAVLGFWWSQWRSAPGGSGLAVAPRTAIDHDHPARG